MPVFEYRCNNCDTKFEVLHKSHKDEDKIYCPECNSVDNKKLFSAFSHSFSGTISSGSGSCADGSCSTESNSGSGGCSSGFCGLN